MSSALDNFLNSLGIDNTTPIDNEEVIPDSEEVLPVVEETPQEEPEPVPLTSTDIDDILQDNGFTQPLYNEAEEITEEESRSEEEEGNTDNIREELPSVSSALHYVGSGEMTNIGDISIDPETGETRVLTEVGVQTIERNLDDEEDADWEERIESGEIREVQTTSSENTEVSTQGLLPLNSPTLLLDESTTRFSGAEWYNEIQRKSIIFGGAGGIGSNAVFQISRMHPAAIFLYDDDSVETVNMAGQLYSRNDVGKAKVTAIADMISSYTNMQNIYAIRERFTEHTEAGNVMMCGFDNMEARKLFYKAWHNHLLQLPTDEQKKCLYLDGRLSLDTLQVFCLTGEDEANMKIYEEQYLFDDSEAEHTVCSMKQTTYLACMIGSIMTNLFTNWVANTIDPIIPYDLPFFTEYDAQNMIFKTIK